MQTNSAVSNDSGMIIRTHPNYKIEFLNKNNNSTYYNYVMKKVIGIIILDV